MPRGLSNRSNWCFVNAILQENTDYVPVITPINPIILCPLPFTLLFLFFRAASKIMLLFLVSINFKMRNKRLLRIFLHFGHQLLKAIYIPDDSFRFGLSNFFLFTSLTPKIYYVYLLKEPTSGGGMPHPIFFFFKMTVTKWICFSTLYL